MIIRPLIPAEFDSALCAQVDSELWFPDKGGSNKTAKELCEACVHTVECLEGALDREERHGIYGGKSERERAAILWARKVVAA